MTKEECIASAINAYVEEQHRIELFRRGVVDYFSLHPDLNRAPLPIIHSIKSRLKSTDHLADKIERKWCDGQIDHTNLFQRITDLAGVRILHLYPQQFEQIHRAIESKVGCGDWCYGEQPKAYTWDPEAKIYFASLGIPSEVKDSLYTSIHYLLKPRCDSPVTCEVQVRTLFEEIWGEIDHYMNYPYPTDSVACKEQLKVLGKLTTTGTRLADSIFNSLKEYGACISRQTIPHEAAASKENQ